MSTTFAATDENPPMSPPAETGSSVDAPDAGSTARTGNAPVRMTRIAGRYEVDLETPVGGGGMARVYHGRDLRTRRDVAVKTLDPDFAGDADIRARFRREARLMAFLGHPNVARVYDFVEDLGTSWVVLEYVDGPSLQEVMSERGPFSLNETAAVLDQVAAALAHLHARSLVHLAVMPQNLLATSEGRIKLIDFGLAQRAGEVQAVANDETAMNAEYLSPEQVAGEPVGAATDIYALGCVVYAMLTGRPPFPEGLAGKRSGDVARAHLEASPRPPSVARPDLRFPEWVDKVVLWALEKEPERRYGDVTAFARLFRSGEEGDAAGGAAATVPLATVDAPRGTVVPGLPRVPVTKERQTAPGLAARSGHGLYRGGGRLARRLARRRASMWRMTIAIGIANVALALLLFATQGRVPGIYDPSPTLHAGDRATVIAPAAIVDAPGSDQLTAGDEMAGQEVAITGPSAVVERVIWWPVSFVTDGQTVDGYVAAAALSGGERETGVDRLRAALGLD